MDNFPPKKKIEMLVHSSSKRKLTNKEVKFILDHIIINTPISKLLKIDYRVIIIALVFITINFIMNLYNILT